MNPPTCGDAADSPQGGLSVSRFREAGREVMIGLMTKVMNPPTCGDAASRPQGGLSVGRPREAGREVMIGLMTKVMNPPTCGFTQLGDREPSEAPDCWSAKIFWVFSGDDGFDDRFDETPSSLWRTWTPPPSDSSEENGRPLGLLPLRGLHVIVWRHVRRRSTDSASTTSPSWLSPCRPRPPGRPATRQPLWSPTK